MIKNVVLDMGMVLLRYDVNVILDGCCKTDEEKEIIKKELFQGEEWKQTDMGNITDDEMYLSVSKRIPERFHDSLKNCIDHWSDFMLPLENAREFCQYLRDKGYNIYVLSNAGIRFYSYFERFLPFDFFDGMVISCDVHVIKPDQKIYLTLLEKYNLKPEECLFIDDMEANVNGAKSVGMNAEVHTGNFERIKEQYNL